MLKLSISNIGGEAIFFSAVTVISRILNFLCFPLLARSFIVDEIGIIDIHITCVMFVSAILLIGLDSALIRYHSEYKKNERLNLLISSSIMLLALISAAAIVGVMIIYITINHWIDGFNYITMNSILFLASIPSVVMFSITEILLRLELRKVKYLILVLGLNFSLLILTSFLYLNSSRTVEMYSVCFFISYLVFGILGLYFVRDYFDLSQFLIPEREILRYAIPMGLVSIVGIFTPFVDRLAIISITDSKMLGMYAAAAKLTVLMSLPVGIFQTAIIPIIIREINNYDFQKKLEILLRIYLGIIITLSITIVSFDKFLIDHILGVNYRDCSVFLAPLIFSVIAQTNISLFGFGTIMTEKIKFKLYLVVIFACTTTALMYILGEKWGVVGLSVGIITGKYFHMVTELKLGRKLFNINFNNLFVNSVTLIAACTLIVLSLFNISLIEKIVFSVIIIISLFIILRININSRSEIN